MRQVLGILVVMVALFSIVPATSFADTMSVSQTIVITARVAPARSIVVNDQGQMIRIYSNTSENVTPKVYRNKAPGPELALSPALQQQYDQVMSRPGNKIGVAINVPVPPEPVDQKLTSLLSTASMMTMRTLLHL